MSSREHASQRSSSRSHSTTWSEALGSVRRVSALQAVLTGPEADRREETANHSGAGSRQQDLVAPSLNAFAIMPLRSDSTSRTHHVAHLRATEPSQSRGHHCPGRVDAADVHPGNPSYAPAGDD